MSKFVDPNWLAANSLNSSTILDYFSLSPFYDRGCNNEVIKMQTAFSGITTDLSDMTGTEYIVEEDPVLVVKKIDRKSKTEYDVLEVFYVVNGVIYEGKCVSELFSTRVCNMYGHLCAALSEIGGRRWFSPYRGFVAKSFRNEAESDEDTMFAIKIMNECGFGPKSF